VNKCIDCKKIITKKSIRCKSYAKKGNLAPSYKHGLTLCLLCNLKVNFNRDYWYAYFRYKMERK